MFGVKLKDEFIFNINDVLGMWTYLEGEGGAASLLDVQVPVWKWNRSFCSVGCAEVLDGKWMRSCRLIGCAESLDG